MNILVITPIYYIEGRENLFHDSNAVHYMLRPWSVEHNILVVHTYLQELPDARRFINAKERAYYKNGYFFEKDSIKVGMVEIQRLFRQGAAMTKKQVVRIERFIKTFTQLNDFHPDILVTHMPTVTSTAASNVFPDVPHVGILHYSDKRNIDVYHSHDVYDLSKTFEALYCRSNAIYEYFNNFDLPNLNQNLINSGVPIDNVRTRSTEKPQKFKFLYAGKLIERKHVDKIILALSHLYDSYDFEFTVIGDGPEKIALKKLARKLLPPEYFKFVDSIPRENVLEAMQENNIFIMPSTSETLGLVYLEAMSRGCIPIGTKGEGIDGIIRNGENGFLVDPDSPTSLENTIRRILDMPESDYSNIVATTQKAGLGFNERDMGFKYRDAIISAVENNPETPPRL